MWKKASYVGFVAILAVAVIVGLSRREKTMAPVGGGDGSERLRVVTTLFPLYDMARSIGGDDADVSLLLPPGMSPHAFEPKPSDVASIEESDVFIYTGSFMEPWAEEVLSGLGRENGVVDASDGTIMIAAEEEHDAEHEDKEEVHGHTGADPHIWLDFDNASVMASHVAEALAKADPDRSEAYADRASEYLLALSDLDREYAERLGNCRSKTVVSGGHRSFGYLAKRYGLGYVAAQGVSSDTEPTASDLSALVELVRRENVSTVFSEILLSPKIAETIAAEAGVEILSLNPGGNLPLEAFEKGTTLFDILRADLESLSTGLGCSVSTL